MGRLVCKLITGIGLGIVGLLVAYEVLLTDPSEYRQVIAAILLVGGLIICWLPSTPEVI